VAIALIAAAATAAFIYFRGTSPETPVLRAFLPPPDKTAFNVRGGLATSSPPALSPDGRRLAFSAVGADGKNQLWIRSLDALTSQPLAGTDGATHPFWSPDSKFIGFFAGGKLKKIDASGGTAIALCSTGSLRGGTWSHSGVIVFATDRLYQVSAVGGVPTALAGIAPSGTAANETSGNNFTPRWPSFLTDGRRVTNLWIRRDTGQFTFDLMSSCGVELHIDSRTLVSLRLARGAPSTSAGRTASTPNA
jgi:hypothetical protein